jgi:hypothetical protein
MRIEVEEDASGLTPPERRWHAIDVETWDGDRGQRDAASGGLRDDADRRDSGSPG